MRNVIAFFCMWFGLILQSTIFQIPPINVIQPNLVLVVLVLVALTRGPRASLVLGIIVGFLQDAAYGSFLGLNAFTYGAIGYFAATTFAQFLSRNVAITLAVTEVCTFAQEWITYGMTRLFDVTGFAWRAVLTFSLEEMIVNGIAVLLFYPLLVKLFASKAKSRYGDADADAV